MCLVLEKLLLEARSIATAIAAQEQQAEQQTATAEMTEIEEVTE